MGRQRCGLNDNYGRARAKAQVLASLGVVLALSVIPGFPGHVFFGTAFLGSFQRLADRSGDSAHTRRAAAVGSAIKWACDWKYYLNQIPRGAVPPVVDADPEMKKFLESPMGLMRRYFQATQTVQLRKNRKKLPPLTECAPVVPHQLERDIEQFEYLASKGILESHVEKYVTDVVLPDYRRTLEVARERTASRGEFRHDLHFAKDFAAYYALHGKALHLHEGKAVEGDAVRPRDFDALQQEFLQKQHRVSVIDDFLSDEALHQLHDFLLQSTFWFDAHTGYVGTYMHTGFASPLVSQIDQELRSKLPQVLEGMELRNAWAYMYDGSLGGINTHADDAQVQINLFLTPTEANLWSADDSQPSGGLVLFGIGPAEDWDLIQMNSAEAQDQIADRIASTGNFKVTVPYVQNRAIMFDSTYFHKTDDMKFKKGYKNRRINVTFLYGERGNLVPQATVSVSSQ